MTELTRVTNENRVLRLELQVLRAEIESSRVRDTIRFGLSQRTLLVTEAELTAYIPYSRRQIIKLRTSGKIPFIRDPLRKNAVLYNLRDIEATLLSGRVALGPLVEEVDWTTIKVAA